MKKLSSKIFYTPGTKDLQSKDAINSQEKKGSRVSRSLQGSVGRWIKIGLLSLIRLYQLLISPVLNPSCRFYPTCSVYARQAIERHGIWKGTRLAIKRLARCHPFGGHGYDPVPKA